MGWTLRKSRDEKTFYEIATQFRPHVLGAILAPLL